MRRPAATPGRRSAAAPRLLAALALVLLAFGSPAAGVPATRVADAAELTAPSFAVAPPGDARLFVTTLAGRIRLLLPGDGLATQPFLDLAERVDDRGEGGLLGLAFDPGWRENGLLYVYYTAPGPDAANPLTSRLSRFEAVGPPESSTAADPGSERILFELDQPATNHNGGTVAFGPDGLLYLGLGDGGGGGDPEDRAQDDGELFGKLLRFDVAPPLPPGRPEPVVVAKGLRNPFRFAFDAATGHLHIGDVGQQRREEIDVLSAADLAADFAGGAAPLNLGWDVKEGSLCFDPDPSEPACDAPELVPPLHEYAHELGRCSVTGGLVYRRPDLPALEGRYLFGDFCTGELWSIPPSPPGPVVERTPLELEPDAGALTRPVALAEGPGRRVFLVDLDGELFRLPEPDAGLLAGAALGALAGLARRLRGGAGRAVGRSVPPARATSRTPPPGSRGARGARCAPRGGGR